eukprot:g188.t1
MSMPYRAKRDSGLVLRRTPSTVGPGLYDVTSKNVSSVRPSYASFWSTSSRSQITPNDYTPGPASYDVNRQMRNKKLSSGTNAFKSKTLRLKDGAVTINQPGPGSYEIGRVFGKRHHREMRKVTSSKSTAFRLKPSMAIPSIPSRHQGHGYEEDGKGEIKKQAPKVHVYSGVGSDTVGPAFYNPVLKSKAYKKTARNMYDVSKTKRDAFGNHKSLYENPGPAHYNPREVTGATTLELLGGQQQSAAFASRVPMSQDLKMNQDLVEGPGPGAYNAPSQFQPTVHSLSRGNDSSSPNGENSSTENAVPPVTTREKAKQIQQFGSTSERSGLTNSLDAPYGRGSRLNTPGPGQYGEHRTAFRTAPIERSELVDDYGFLSSAPRACNQVPDLRDNRLGPGTYDDYNGTLVHELRRKISSRGGAFGTSSERFKFGAFAKADENSIMNKLYHSQEVDDDYGYGGGAEERKDDHGRGGATVQQQFNGNTRRTVGDTYK